MFVAYTNHGVCGATANMFAACQPVAEQCLHHADGVGQSGTSVSNRNDRFGNS
jgi:hypothetical protein